MNGAAAAVAFPTIKAIKPVIPGVHDPGSHWLIVAGRAVNAVFAVGNCAQIVLAATAVATALLMLRTGAAPRRPSPHIWLAATGLAVALLAYYRLVVWHRMDAHLTGFWEAAYSNREGAQGSADSAREAFRSDHPLASRLLVGTLLCSLAALLSGTWMLLAGRDHT